MNTDVAQNIGAGNSKLLTPRQFYEYFGGAVGLSSIYSAIRSKRIHHIKLGKQKVLILPSEIEDWPRREALGVK